MMDLVRICPSCSSERPISEMHCGGALASGDLCHWRLADVAPTSRGQHAALSRKGKEDTTPEPVLESSVRLCVNGHAVPEDEFLCLECGGDIVETPESVATENAESCTARSFIGERIEGWTICEVIVSAGKSRDCFRVENNAGVPGYLVLFHEQHEPDTTIYDVLRNTDHDHVPDILLTGRWQQRSFEVVEWIEGGSLGEHDYFNSNDLAAFRRITDELGRALHDLAEMGVRHRNICPRSILIRSNEPLDLVVTDFSSARLSDFDLDTVAPLDITRYSAPETIVGGVSTASDWWGLGMILLEQATAGACFEGINEQAFTIHVVTRGIEVPDNIAAPLRPLLQGLLARNPLQRWQWEEVRRWLRDEPVEVPEEHRQVNASDNNERITINDVAYTDPQHLALGLATEAHWEAGLQCFEKGKLATWLQSSFAETAMPGKIRRLSSQTSVARHWRFALALMELNPALPLVNNGTLVTPAWLLDHPIEGFELITGELPSYLEAMEREPWLVNLYYRHQRVLERAKLLEIDVDYDRLRITALATSRANLDAERDRLRELYPSSGHDALASLMEKTRLNEEDLVLLLCAKAAQFTPLALVVEEAIALGKKYDKTPLQPEEICALVILSRRELYRKLDEKIIDFARCASVTLDHWADDFRVQRRISLPRAVVLLSLANDAWIVPPKQDYVANILQFFEKRVANSVMRGPLVRLTVAKTSARIDMTELNSALKPSTALVEHVLCRNDSPVQVDPQVVQQDPVRERRLWRLDQTASNNRRDTGIDTLYLGFPFLIAGSEKARPRVAPIFLWPIRMGFTIGAGAKFSLAYDMDRVEMRLNPALEGIVGQAAMKKWRRIHNEVLESEKLSVNDVIDAVSTLAPATKRGLQSHPSTTFKVAEDTFSCHGSAVIFNAQFSGQAIAEDLRHLQGLSIADTALESLLRINEVQIANHSDGVIEAERYSVVPADPSQDKAVLQGRISPGVVVEGPPGTGKSQTIVNIIADCMGRREKVLVVCQKQAALRVVEKRLEAVKLNHRILTVTDIGKDRQSVISSIRVQVPNVLNADTSVVRQAKQRRLQVAASIDHLERELNKRHTVINKCDEFSGLTYRQILCELIGTDTHGKETVIAQPTLRRLLNSVGPATLAMLEEQCASLAADWLHANYEYSALHSFVVFNTDGAISNTIKHNFTDFHDAERARVALADKTSSAYDNKNLTELSCWGETYLTKIKALDGEQVAIAKTWFDLFYDEVNEKSEGEDILATLKAQYKDLNSLDVNHHDDRFYSALNMLDIDILERQLKICERLAMPVSGIGKYSPIRYWKKRKIAKFLSLQNEPFSQENIESLYNAIQLELVLNSLRKKLSGALNRLSRPLDKGAEHTLKYLRRTVSPSIKRADLMVNLCRVIKLCPLRNDAKQMLRSGSEESLSRFVILYQDTIDRALVRDASLNALDKLSPWMDENWVEERKGEILHSEHDLDGICAISKDLDTLSDYQRFRLRTKDVEPIVFQVFKELRNVEHTLKTFPSSHLGPLVRHNVRREAFLGWKLRIEESMPSVLIGSNELEEKIRNLAELDELKTNLNQVLLISDIETGALGSQTQWNDITRLRGPRYKKLREFIDLGREQGLMELRPIWMMSPEAVSQALPRLAGMFDVVVFDEASQMTVDFAIPALYRAKRVIISGDEKQMPPSNFFSSSVEADEDESIEELDEDASEAEISLHEDAWNRREIKDCPDLLVLGKTVLPTKTLEIHYRSDFRALIDFSNYAYYAGKLHVPALHPDAVIVKEKPIEVHSVNGIYTNQTNIVEAEKLVELIAEMWQKPPENRPSIGVVTFNKKQSELIEDTLQAYAEKDPDFYKAYLREQDREQNGEDMGFFVKNVENVQGDERDVIFFSTTFGLNEHGSFRRNFGVLGHKGGERRLNVAVTRARQKIAIVTSMPIRDISDMLTTGRLPTKPRDFIQAYLEYASKISAGDVKNAKQRISRIAKSVTRSGHNERSDGFTQSVEQFICSLGYKPERGTSEDAFNVDLAIIDPLTGQYGIGIECDAPVNGLLHNTRSRDIWRPRVLEKSIPLLHRINCYDWYQDNDKEKKKLKDRIIQAVGT